MYYVVNCATAVITEDGSVSATCYCHGIYTNKRRAKDGTAECLEEVIQNLREDAEAQDDPELLSSIRTYGSMDEEYFEVDYICGDSPVEVYIRLEEKDLSIY